MKKAWTIKSKTAAALILAALFAAATLLISESAADTSAAKIEDSAPAAPIANSPIPKVNIMAVGDMMIGNWGEDLLRKNGPNYPFEKVAPFLQKADIATGNLEGSHCVGGAAMDKKYVFRINPKWLAGYKWAGFDVFTVANNHAMDYGGDCFCQSNNEIAKMGMKVCGGGKNVTVGNRPAVIEKNNIKTAFLGYSATYPKEAWAGVSSPGTIFPERNRVIRAVKDASEKYDLVVVHFHWGGEGRTVPKDYQRDLAHLAIDNGADLIIGHHPHVLQGIELYKERLIFYSLGNFIFASYSKQAKTSVIANVDLDKNGNVLRAGVIPVNVYNYDIHLQTAPIPKDPAIIAELNEATSQITWGTPAMVDKNGMIMINVK